jgi:excisionase family DNA binding protein
MTNISLLTTEEAAEYLRLKPGTIRNWVNTHKIPYIKMGRNVRFDMKVLDAWLKRKGVEESTIWR